MGVVEDDRHRQVTDACPSGTVNVGNLFYESRQDEREVIARGLERELS